MTGKPRIPHLKWHHDIKYHLKSEVSVVSYVQTVTQHFKSQLFEKHLCNPRIPKERNGATCPSYINDCLKSEVSIMLCCRLCSACYTAVRIKNCSKSTSAIKVATVKNMDDFRYEGNPSRVTAKSTLFAVSKDEWDTKEDTGKFMKNALYVLQYAKRHLSGRNNIEQ